MSIYLVYSDEQADRARISARYSNPWDGLEDLHFPGIFVDSIPDPETPAGMEAVLMVQLPAETSEDHPILYYDYRALPEPEETQVQRLNRQIAEQEVRLGDVEIMLADVVMGGGD